MASGDRGESPFTIGVQTDGDADIARVFVEGEWQGDPEEARELLEAICVAMEGHPSLEYIVLSGGFLCLPWPESIKRWSIGDLVQPPEQIVDQLMEYGAKKVKELFMGTTGRRLRQVTRRLTLGVDAYYFMGSVWDPHAELIFAADLATGNLWRTGKSYPNPKQQRGLVRVTDLQSHFIETGDKKVMLLGCHDLNMFSQRSAHNARGWRAETILEFRRRALNEKPDLLIWHPHKSDTPRTWLAGLCGLKKLLPGIQYASAGIYHNDGNAPRAILSQVLKGTKNTGTIDLIVKRKS